MSYAKHGVKVFGLCLVAALATMAFAASAAQAAWSVEGIPISESLKPTISGHELANFLLLAFAGGIKVEIHCELLQVDGFIQDIVGFKLHGHATLKFTKNCKTFLNLVESVNCKPLPTTEAKVLFKLFKHNSTTYILFTPLISPNFVTLHLGLDPGTCVLGLFINVTGSIVAECLFIACSEKGVPHRVSAVLPGLFASHELKFLGSAASFHGAVTLEMTGAHAGKGWSGLG